MKQALCAEAIGTLVLEMTVVGPELWPVNFRAALTVWL